jgi:hypothetical protein
LTLPGPARVETAQLFSESSARANPVLEWNQIFIDTLIATGTPNSSSQRLGAIVHTAMFDAYNGIDQRYTPIFIRTTAPNGASRGAAVVAAAYTALVGPIKEWLVLSTPSPSTVSKLKSPAEPFHQACRRSKS